MATENQKQDLARRLVEREIYYCVSYLISGLANIACEVSHRVWDGAFGGDNEEVYDWCRTIDWEEAAVAAINDAEYDQLAEWADEDGYVSDVLIEFGTSWSYVHDWMAAHPDRVSELEKALREYIIQQTPSWRDWCRTNDIDTDDYQSEVYEHWLISDWLAAKLRERGQLVFEFANMTIWGRGCTGQSICLDHVIQQIALELRGDELQEAAA